MPRPREFDVDDVIDRAVEVFWETGYAGTSIEELLSRLGLARASLYRTFGSKEELYQRALARYRQRYADRLTTCLQGGGRASLRALFELVVAESQERRTPPGCFVVNATTERVPADPATTAQVLEQYAALEEAFASALAEEDRHATAADATRQARFLVASLQGLRVLEKAGVARDVLDDVVDATFAAL